MKRILLIGIRMDRGGTEKALLSLLSALDPCQFSVSLLLAEHRGPWMERIPKTVRLLPPMRNGILFTLSRRNAFRVLSKLRFQGKARFLLQSTERFRDMLRNRSGAFERFFIDLMKVSCHQFSEEYPNEEFDAAFAFSGDRTMFYLCEKMCCQQKYVFQHFDFRYPKRDEGIYRAYFGQCRAVFSVSKSCTELLQRTFPELKYKFKTFYNVIDPTEIQRLSQRGVGLPSVGDGSFRILSAMRICRQKGADHIPSILKRLTDAGLPAHWFLIGDGNKRDIRRLFKTAKSLGVESVLHYLGSVNNPYPMMEDCDLFVLPTRYEGMPIVIEECKILATPIITTDYLSAREQLENGRLAPIVPFSEMALAKAIADLLSHSHKRKIYKERLSTVKVPPRDINQELNEILFSDDNC